MAIQNRFTFVRHFVGVSYNFHAQVIFFTVDERGRGYRCLTEVAHSLSNQHEIIQYILLIS